MAYILRSLAVIGVIALNSPVHGSKSAGDEHAPVAREHAWPALPIDMRALETRGGTGALSAAREAAEILAGLDPETRERLLTLAATATTGRAPSR